MMPDEFDKKRDVVKSLMSMLHSSANDEMGKHMAPKKEVSMEKVSVKPGMPSDMHSPECDGMCKGGCAGYSKGGMVDLTKDQSRMEPTSVDMHMSDGGMALASDQPEDEMVSDLTPQMGASHEGPNAGEGDPAKVHDTSVEEEDDENNQSAFGMFKRKK